MAKKNPAAEPPEPPALPEGVVWKGNPVLVPHLVAVASLEEDPDNDNVHPEESINELAKSYHRFGQQRDVVLAADGRTVKAGSGQLRAVARLGWTHIAAIPSDLPADDLQHFAWADNRTPRLSALNMASIAEKMRVQQEQGRSFEGTGFDRAEVDGLLARARADAAERAIDDVANGGADDPSPTPSMPGGVPQGYKSFVLVLTEDQDRDVREAVKLAKGKHGLATSPEGLHEVCRAYLEAESATEQDGE